MPPEAIGFPSWLVEIASIAPAFTLLIAAVAVIPAWITVWRAGKRTRSQMWWSDLQWAIDATLSDDPRRREVGLTTLKMLADQGWLEAGELVVLESVMQNIPLDLADPASSPPKHRRLPPQSSADLEMND